MGMLISRHKHRHVKAYTGPTDEPTPVEQVVDEESVEDVDTADKKKRKKTE